MPSTAIDRMAESALLRLVVLLVTCSLLLALASATRRVGDHNAAAKPCQIAFKGKTVDVGGQMGWALGINATWKQPTIYVGDRLRFTWPYPPSEGGPNPVMEHNVWTMQNQRAFDTCNFRGGRELSEISPCTTRPLKNPGVIYFGCEEDRHCVRGQKVAIRVVKAPAKLPCPKPPPPPATNGEIKIGKFPEFWTIVMTGWQQPKVVKGNTLVFIWDKNSANPPHDVRTFKSKRAFDACDFTGSKLVGAVLTQGVAKYKVTQAAGSTIYFGCAVTFHCRAGMKVKINVS